MAAAPPIMIRQLRSRVPLTVGRAEILAVDFVHNQLATGLQLLILTVIDAYSRSSPTVGPRPRFRAPNVIKILHCGCGEIGYPASIKNAIRSSLCPVIFIVSSLLVAQHKSEESYTN